MELDIFLFAPIRGNKKVLFVQINSDKNVKFTYKNGFLYSLIALFTASRRSLRLYSRDLVSGIVKASTLPPLDSGISQVRSRPVMISLVGLSQPRSLDRVFS